MMGEESEGESSLEVEVSEEGEGESEQDSQEEETKRIRKKQEKEEREGRDERGKGGEIDIMVCTHCQRKEGMEKREYTQEEKTERLCRIHGITLLEEKVLREWEKRMGKGEGGMRKENIVENHDKNKGQKQEGEGEGEKRRGKEEREEGGKDSGTRDCRGPGGRGEPPRHNAPSKGEEAAATTSPKPPKTQEGERLNVEVPEEFGGRKGMEGKEGEGSGEGREEEREKVGKK